MAASYFFYDLETSGFSPSAARVMQFAGQRTDADLKPICEPVNVLIKLSPDVLPDPDAVMLTGITPQATIMDGLTEAEFLRYFYDEIVQKETTFLGYNSVRFDDEFMRFLHYRNFYDPYEWQWADGCSRWDILDLVRMTRALRPDGIKWPVTEDGKSTNRLELLTKLNDLNHDHAHDALSDVLATIAVAKLIRDKQPDLFKYLFEHRSKKAVSEIVLQGQPFVYTTGRYPSEYLHTSIAILLSKHPQQDCALVYNLRHDPAPFMALSPEQLAEAWRFKKDRPANEPRLPVKTLKYNRCPAIAPLGVMKDAETQKRLNITIEATTTNMQKLRSGHQEFARKVLAALQILDADRNQEHAKPDWMTVDSMLYDGFFDNEDKQTMRALRAAGPEELEKIAHNLKDDRLKQLLPLYKARNYSSYLTGEERTAWDGYVHDRLFSGGAQSRLSTYFNRLQELAAKPLTSQQEYLLEELQLYGESIVPADLSNQDA